MTTVGGYPPLGLGILVLLVGTRCSKEATGSGGEGQGTDRQVASLRALGALHPSRRHKPKGQQASQRPCLSHPQGGCLHI